MNIESEYVTWVQPVLTSNTSYGVVSSTSITSPHEPYCAFDGIKTGENKYASSSTSGGDITWQLPYNVKISSCKVYTTTETGYLARFPQSITLKASNDGSTWTTVGSASSYSQPTSGGYVTVTVATPTPYTYYKWEFGQSFGSSGGVAIGEIEITATYLKTYVPMKAYLHNNTYNMKIDASSVVSNVIKNGTLTDNNCVISGFSATNYATVPKSFEFGSGTWEICIKFRVYSDKNYNQRIFALKTSNNNFALGISKFSSDNAYYPNKLWMGVYNSSYSGVPIVYKQDFSATNNQYYWVKLMYDGEKYTVSTSTNGTNFATRDTETSSTVLTTTDTLFGYLGSDADSRYLDGDIDLNESYIKKDGVIWWNGTVPAKKYYGINI